MLRVANIDAVRPFEVQVPPGAGDDFDGRRQGAVPGLELAKGLLAAVVGVDVEDPDAGGRGQWRSPTL